MATMTPQYHDLMQEFEVNLRGAAHLYEQLGNTPAGSAEQDLILASLTDMKEKLQKMSNDLCFIILNQRSRLTRQDLAEGQRMIAGTIEVLKKYQTLSSPA